MNKLGFGFMRMPLTNPDDQSKILTIVERAGGLTPAATPNRTQGAAMRPPWL